MRNNIDSTRLVLDAIKANDVPYLVHISSSVVESVADDFYTNTKKDQEKMVLESGIPCPVLRPTLMFGWFDRKHLGWLSRFMKKVPVFPIPGHGRYMRQPLYVGDFANIIISCIEHRVRDGDLQHFRARESGLHRHDPRDQARDAGRYDHPAYSVFFVLRFALGLGFVRQEPAFHHAAAGSLECQG